jgi:hypothetical protein
MFMYSFRMYLGIELHRRIGHNGWNYGIMSSLRKLWFTQVFNNSEISELSSDNDCSVFHLVSKIMLELL